VMPFDGSEQLTASSEERRRGRAQSGTSSTLRALRVNPPRPPFVRQRREDDPERGSLG